MSKYTPIFSFTNQKGGVGKTTCAINLAAEFGKMGKKVLLVDCDPQGNATTGLGVEKRTIEKSLYQVIIGKAKADEAIIQTKWKGIWLLPATLDLAGAEIELVSAISRELRLKRALDEVKQSFDLIFIDCPPSLGLLTINALSASTDVILPVQCEFYALEGLSQLLHTIELVKTHLNPEIKLSGIILTMYDTRTNLSKEVAEELRRQFKELVFDTVIPRNVKLGEAPSFGKPITYYAPSSSGAKSFKALSEEVAKKWLKRL